MGKRYIQTNDPGPVEIGDEWFPPQGEPFFHKVWTGGTHGWTTGVFGARPADIDDPAVVDELDEEDLEELDELNEIDDEDEDDEDDESNEENDDV